MCGELLDQLTSTFAPDIDHDDLNGDVPLLERISLYRKYAQFCEDRGETLNTASVSIWTWHILKEQFDAEVLADLPFQEDLPNEVKSMCAETEAFHEERRKQEIVDLRKHITTASVYAESIGIDCQPLMRCLPIGGPDVPWDSRQIGYYYPSRETIFEGIMLCRRLWARARSQWTPGQGGEIENEDEDLNEVPGGASLDPNSREAKAKLMMQHIDANPDGMQWKQLAAIKGVEIEPITARSDYREFLVRNGYHMKRGKGWVKAAK